MKAGASITYDVTKQLFQPLQNGVYRFAGSPTAAPNPFQFDQSFALVPEARLMYPKADGRQRLLPGRLARPRQPDPQPRAALRRRVHQGHPRLAGRHRRQQLRPARRLRLGSARRSEVGDPRRHRPLHAAASDLHHRQGRRRRAQRPGDAVAGARPTRCSRPSRTCLPAFPPGAVLPARNIQEISPDLENEFAWAGNIAVQRQIGSRASVEIAANINRGQKHGFLDVNQRRRRSTRRR